MTNLPSTTLLFSMPGGSEWILIVLIVLLMFGGKKIPDLMRGIGKGIKEFKDAKDQVSSEIEQGMKETPSRKEEMAIPVKA
ncbi:MAG: twin-arginine translocase TatA/TatE family subunit [Gloeobacteraceae cyanobacterium ES-bin-316]|nr:twin-arginine translocase TatA/TatE family subunit [Ferruginibacter sp.]